MSETKDYKKEYKALYLPKTEPMIIDIPEIYLSDPRKTDSAKLKNVLRIPDLCLKKII